MTVILRYHSMLFQGTFTNDRIYPFRVHVSNLNKNNATLRVRHVTDPITIFSILKQALTDKLQSILS